MKRIILQTDRLTIGYHQTPVVKELNLKIFKGQAVCILGPNGSGKSTILRSLAALLAPLGGVVYLNGENLSFLNATTRARQMGVVLTERDTPELFTVFEVVAAGRSPHTGFLGRLNSVDLEKIEESLGLVEAEPLKNKYFNELSDGEKQKVILARTLAQDTEVIILDEPTSFLDLKYRTEIIRLLNKLCRAKGITVILSLHDLELAAKCCEIAVLVQAGRIVAAGPVEEVVREELINQVYETKAISYSSSLGGVELTNRFTPGIFVVGGAGSGTPVYRMLTRHGYGFRTGVIHQNDLDYQVARAMRVEIVTANSFEKINPSAFNAAFKLIAESSAIIDAGFPLGVTNRENLKLLQEALKMLKPVLSLRPETDCRELYAIAPGTWRSLNDLQEIKTVLAGINFPIIKG